ncbi:MAG: hypothetical protein WC184_00235 [Acidimicrobiia bacterium]
MSDISKGPGWWQASDGRWYPPPSNATATPPKPSTLQKPPLWKKPIPLWVTAGIAGSALLLGFVFSPSRESSNDAQFSSAQPEADRDMSSGGEPRKAEQREAHNTTSTTLKRVPSTTTSVRAARGARDNPYTLGSTLVSDKGLEITVNSVNFEAGPIIAAENMFNDPAPAGSQYILINVTVTNGTDEPIDPGWEVNIEAIGSKNQVHGKCYQVTPNNLRDAPQLYPGGSASGNVCIGVFEEEIVDGSILVMVSEQFAFNKPVFVSAH